ncbi:MAG: CorA family divalent cation transporter [Thermoplasmata archaeon]
MLSNKKDKNSKLNSDRITNTNREIQNYNKSFSKIKKSSPTRSTTPMSAEASADTFIAKKEITEESRWKTQRKQLQAKVELILSDSFMIFLAILMIPLVLIQMFDIFPQSLVTVAKVIDNSILVIFIVEYILKLILAEKKLDYFINPWHILDLFIILLPIGEILGFFKFTFFRNTPILRSLRVLRIIAVGSKGLVRQAVGGKKKGGTEPQFSRMKIIGLDESLSNIKRNMTVQEAENFLLSEPVTWLDISGVSRIDIPTLEKLLNVPAEILSSRLFELAYPRPGGQTSYIFIHARLPTLNTCGNGFQQIIIEQKDICIFLSGRNIVTITSDEMSAFDEIIGEASENSKKGYPLLVAILKAIFEILNRRYSEVIAHIESEVLRMESLLPENPPAGFLENSFYLKKEMNFLVTNLAHLKDTLENLLSGKIPLQGFEEKHKVMFEEAEESASSLLESATTAKENLISLIELFINTTSYDMNKVMRWLAVITCITFIPSIALAFFQVGFEGTPSGVLAWQFIVLSSIVMFFVGYIFAKLGWMRLD